MVLTLSRADVHLGTLAPSAKQTSMTVVPTPARMGGFAL